MLDSRPPGWQRVALTDAAPLCPWVWRRKNPKKPHMRLSFFFLFLLGWHSCLWAEKVAPALILLWDLSSHVRLFFFKFVCAHTRSRAAVTAAYQLNQQYFAYLREWYMDGLGGAGDDQVFVFLFFSNQYICLCMSTSSQCIQYPGFALILVLRNQIVFLLPGELWELCIRSNRSYRQRPTPCRATYQQIACANQKQSSETGCSD